MFRANCTTLDRLRLAPDPDSGGSNRYTGNAGDVLEAGVVGAGISSGIAHLAKDPEIVLVTGRVTLVQHRRAHYQHSEHAQLL